MVLVKREFRSDIMTRRVYFDTQAPDDPERSYQEIKDSEGKSVPVPGVVKGDDYEIHLSPPELKEVDQSWRPARQMLHKIKQAKKPPQVKIFRKDGESLTLVACTLDETEFNLATDGEVENKLSGYFEIRR